MRTSNERKIQNEEEEKKIETKTHTHELHLGRTQQRFITYPTYLLPKYG